MWSGGGHRFSNLCYPSDTIRWHYPHAADRLKQLQALEESQKFKGDTILPFILFIKPFYVSHWHDVHINKWYHTQNVSKHSLPNIILSIRRMLVFTKRKMTSAALASVNAAEWQNAKNKGCATINVKNKRVADTGIELLSWNWVNHTTDDQTQGMIIKETH